MQIPAVKALSPLVGLPVDVLWEGWGRFRDYTGILLGDIFPYGLPLELFWHRGEVVDLVVGNSIEKGFMETLRRLLMLEVFDFVEEISELLCFAEGGMFGC